MTAPLINLVDGTPMDVEGWKFIGSKAESMSSYVRNAHQHKKAVDADFDAERRIWGSGVHVMRAVQHPIDPKKRGDHYPITVVAVGEKCQHRTDWDRVIWTNEEPHHNVARVFVGREELEDA